MNVFVSELLQKFAMGGERIVYFDFGYVAVPAETLRAPCFAGKTNIEVANADEIAGNLLAIG